MELFKITCVTCRARLSVRDEGAIGKIIACPRCGSMVQVTRPEGFVSAPAATPVIDQKTLHSSPAPPAPIPGASISSNTFEQNVLFEPDTLAPVDGGAMAAQASAPVDVIASTASVDASSWWSLKLATVAAAAAIGGAAAVAGFVAVRSDDEPQVAQAVVEAPAEAKAQAAPDADAEATPIEASESPVEESDSKTKPPVEPQASETEASSEPVEIDDAPTPSPTSPVDANQAPRVADQPPQDAPPVENITPQQRFAIDPLAVDPEGLDLAMLLERPQPDAELEKIAEGPPVPSSTPTPPQSADANVALGATPPIVADVAPADLPALLARTYPSLAVEKMPICRLVDFATQLSGVAVSVSPDELRSAGVSPAAPVSAKVEDATVEQFLARALKSLRLTPQVAEHQIELVRTGGDPARTIAYPLDDLAATPADARRLADWIEQLVAPAEAAALSPSQFDLDGLRLRIERPQSSQYETLVILERYRRARGLAPRSKYPSALLGPIAASRNLRERMAGPATFTFAAPTPLREVCRYWQEELGVAILVDWPALAEERLWPQSPVRTSARATPWGEALDASLGPLGLGWRAIGRRAIEVTTLAKIASVPAIEVYALDATKLSDGSNLVERIAELGRGEQVPPVAFHDDAHHVLLVRASAKVQRQIAQWLTADGLLAEESSASR